MYICIYRIKLRIYVIPVTTRLLRRRNFTLSTRRLCGQN